MGLLIAHCSLGKMQLATVIMIPRYHNFLSNQTKEQRIDFMKPKLALGETGISLIHPENGIWNSPYLKDVRAWNLAWKSWMSWPRQPVPLELEEIAPLFGDHSIAAFPLLLVTPPSPGWGTQGLSLTGLEDMQLPSIPEQQKARKQRTGMRTHVSLFFGKYICRDNEIHNCQFGLIPLASLLLGPGKDVISSN